MDRCRYDTTAAITATGSSPAARSSHHRQPAGHKIRANSSTATSSSTGQHTADTTPPTGGLQPAVASGGGMNVAATFAATDTHPPSATPA
ncbi:hypothetical protein [Phytohabitans houttuyneae]|uniref:Uncharacterized protein n=1 Tax=Phytohabitans houttuyneae TaxID=1076126 RepID=A0A6V8K8I1_9ACTN|nr:hypothetical protein [Phytohabitans houttuyneae]GFJ78316.1 hypothetical protein Phou_024960 [Phytohabitans houttuyneae]